MSLISHQSPEKSTRKSLDRTEKINAGFQWGTHTWQSAINDLRLVAARVTKLNALLALGEVQLASTSYVDSGGNTRPLMWRTQDNIMVSFTVEEFLRFGAALDEFVEDKYFESWQ